MEFILHLNALFSIDSAYNDDLNIFLILKSTVLFLLYYFLYMYEEYPCKYGKKIGIHAKL